MAASLSQLRQTDQFMLDSYTGEGGYLLGSYLARFPRESDAKFQARQEIAIYPNYTKKVVDIYGGFLWQDDPTREADDLYTRFIANADGNKHSLNSVLQQAHRLALLLGTVYLIVDKPAVQAANRAEEPLPYIVIRRRSELGYHIVDAQGRMMECCFAETGPDGKPQYRHFDAQGWKVTSDAEGNQVLGDANGRSMQGAYSFGRPPVVALHPSVPLDPRRPWACPWARGIAELNWSLYNLDSEQRLLFRSQAFAIPTMPVPNLSADLIDKYQNLALGPDRILFFDPAQGSSKPEYIAPPKDPISQYQDKIDKTVEGIYQLANLEFTYSGTGGVQAAAGLAFHFQEANRTLAGMASLIEEAEREVAFFVDGWMGREWKGNIAYPRDFNLADLNQALQQAMEAVNLSISPTFDQELKKRLARQILGHRTAQATLGTIDNEIEAGGDPYGDRLAKQADPGLTLKP